MPGVLIRRATEADVAVLPALEAAAGALFRGLGMDEVADDPPPEVAVFAAAERAGRLLVAVIDGKVVGFALLRELDGALHVDQVSVAPEAGRRGIGRGLMDAAADLASQQGFSVMTLTTFRDVRFNGPFYASLSPGERSGVVDVHAGMHLAPQTAADQPGDDGRCQTRVECLAAADQAVLQLEQPARL